mmetsp:Transcript_11205/g.14746  ORF Transcript_11205/g.14746 Transcript_11205/m.14746 type:complete len:146 (-) Transcript_11205:12-449(-)
MVTKAVKREDEAEQAAALMAGDDKMDSRREETGETTDDRVRNTSVEGAEEKVTVNGETFGKIRKEKFNSLMTELVIKKGTKLMDKMQLSLLCRRMNCREKRENDKPVKGLFLYLQDKQKKQDEFFEQEELLPVPNFCTKLNRSYM